MLLVLHNSFLHPKREKDSNTGIDLSRIFTRKEFLLLMPSNKNILWLTQQETTAGEQICDETFFGSRMEH